MSCGKRGKEGCRDNDEIGGLGLEDRKECWRFLVSLVIFLVCLFIVITECFLKVGIMGWVIGKKDGEDFCDLMDMG